MRVAKNAWNSHHFGQFFRRERDAVSRFFERAKVKKIRCCTVLQVLQCLDGISVVRFYVLLFKLNLVLLTCIKWPLLKVGS